MKLYKNTLSASIILFLICTILSFVFEFTCFSKIKVIPFITDFLVGVACSFIVVIITTYLQFKYEQRKILNSILKDIHSLFFHFQMVVWSADPYEKVSDKIWEYNYERIYELVGDISSEILNIEWYSKKKSRIKFDLQKAILLLRIE